MSDVEGWQFGASTGMVFLQQDANYLFSVDAPVHLIDNEAEVPFTENNQTLYVSTDIPVGSSYIRPGWSLSIERSNGQLFANVSKAIFSGSLVQSGCFYRCLHQRRL